MHELEKSQSRFPKTTSPLVPRSTMRQISSDTCMLETSTSPTASPPRNLLTLGTQYA